MELLFKRDQTLPIFNKVRFKLWGKVELDEDEQELMKRYQFDNAVLIDAMQPKLIRSSIIAGALAGITLAMLLGAGGSVDWAVFGGLACGVGAGYWWYHEHRETIFVRDLLHGRYFECASLVELARKEAWLTTVVSFLRSWRVQSIGRVRSQSILRRCQRTKHGG